MASVPMEAGRYRAIDADQEHAPRAFPDDKI